MALVGVTSCSSGCIIGARYSGQAQVGTTTLKTFVSGQSKPHTLCFWGKDGLLAAWETHDLSPPSAGVGYQPDVILWHSLLCPALQGSSQHNPWEIQASAQHGRSVTVRNGSLPGLVLASPPLLLPSHTPSSTARQSHANKYNSQRREGKRAQLIPALHS